MTAPATGHEADATELGEPGLLRRRSRFAPLGVVTGVGRGVLAAVVVLAPLGLLTGWREWWGIAVAGAVVFGLAVVSSLGTFSYELQLRVSDRRVVVGADGRAGVRVRNTGRRRALPASLEVGMAGRTYAASLPGLPVDGYFDVVLPVPTRRRAVLEVGPVRAVRGDALGLIRRVVSWPLAEKVYVHPRTGRTEGALAGNVRDLEGEQSSVRTPSDLSFHALRDYVPGDDLRHVHWKSTARTGSLLIREFLETHRSLIVVALSTDPADYSGEDEFELAVSCAGSMVTGLLRTGRSVLMMAGRTEIRGTHPDEVLDRMCSIEQDERCGLTAMVGAAARREPQASLLVPVFGAVPVAAAIHAAYRMGPAGAKVLGIRARAADSPHPYGARSASTLTVPELAALPTLLRGAGR